MMNQSIRSAIGRSAMIVDDNPTVCNVTAAMMSDLGYSVQKFYGGDSAIARFQYSPCDLLITDYEMPGIDGLQLGQRIKSLSPQTRIVIMTGLWRTAVEEKMNNPTIDAWLFKPFKLEELESVLFSIDMPYTQCCPTGAVNEAGFYS